MKETQISSIPESAKRRHILNLQAVWIIFVLLYLILLWVRPLFSPDEVRYAEIAREMLETNDFITPRLNGARYFEKPVMGYWLIAGSMKLFGETNFAVRLVSALATGFTALLVFLAGKRMLPKVEAGYCAVGCYLLMPLVFITGTTCTLDALFSLFVSATVVSFFMATDAMGKKRRKRCFLWLLLTGAAAGFGFLVKGFLAFALPAAAVLPWLIWQKNWKWIFLSPWIPFAAALAVAAPWALAIHQAQPEYWYYFVVVEHFNRFFGGGEAQHPEGPFFFLLVLLWGAAPFFLLLPSIGCGFRRLGVKSDWMRMLISWFAGPFLLLSLSSGKLPTYILPCMSPLAIMISAALFQYFGKDGKEHRKLFDVPLTILVILVFIGIPVAAILISVVLPQKFDIILFQKEESWKLIVAVNALILTWFCLIVARMEKTPPRKLCYFMAALVPVFCATFFIIPGSVYDARCPDDFLKEHSSMVSPDTILIGQRSTFHSVCYAYKRRDIYVMFPGELTHGLSFPEDSHRNLPFKNVGQLMKENQGRSIVMVFPTDRYFEWAGKEFPAPLEVVKSSESPSGFSIIRFQ